MELTNREAGVALCVASGMQNKQIAFFYGTSDQTVRNHISSIMDKTRTTDRTNIALWWWRYAIISNGAPLYNSVKREKPSQEKYYQTRKKISKLQWAEFLQANGNKCFCCGSTENLTKDHVIPLSIGGTVGLENIQPLCRSCNSRKGNKTIDYR